MSIPNTDDDFGIFDTFAEVSEEKACLHHGMDRFRGIAVCLDCGQEFPDEFDAEKEYKFIKTNGSTGRQIRRVYDKSIYKDLETYDIPHDIQMAQIVKIYADFACRL